MLQPNSKFGYISGVKFDQKINGLIHFLILNTNSQKSGFQDLD